MSNDTPVGDIIVYDCYENIDKHQMTVASTIDNDDNSNDKNVIAVKELIVDTSIGNNNETNSNLFRIGYNDKKGRGLYATKYIPPNTIIHVAPCISIIKNDYINHMQYTILEHYLFNDNSNGNKMLALGYGSLFNHSNTPNITYKVDTINQCIIYKSGYKSIPMNDELCITYGTNLWFTNVEEKNQQEQTSVTSALASSISGSSDDDTSEGIRKMFKTS